MSLEEKIIESFSWKKNAEYCAKRLGISVDQYNSEKKKVNITYAKNFKEKGDSMLLKKTLNTLPKSPDEIIKLLNIDTRYWTLRNYWNKQADKGNWIISAHIVKNTKPNNKDYLLDVIDNWKPKIPNFKRPNYRNKKARKVGAVLSIQDLHYGKLNNEGIEQDFKSAIQDLIERTVSGHNIESLYFVIGGDLLNVDTFNKTTTSGTPVENSMTAYDAYTVAFDSFYWAINYLKCFCNTLNIVYVPGNHDRLTSFTLVHALEKAISFPNIAWHNEYKERKALNYYDNFFGFEHGDVKSKDTPLIYATEHSTIWGKTKHRVLFTGHYHKNKKVEYITEDETVGFTFKIIPSLSKTDYWHNHNKFVGNARAALIDLYDPKKGFIGQMRYLAD